MTEENLLVYDQLEALAAQLDDAELFNTAACKSIREVAKQNSENQSKLKKFKKTIDKLQPKLESILALRAEYTNVVELFNVLVVDPAYPKDDENKRLFKSRESIYSKMKDYENINAITQKTKTAVTALVKQIQKFNDNAKNAINKNKVEPIILEGIKLRKSIEGWKRVIDPVNDPSKDACVQLISNAENAVKTNSTFDAGILMKQLKNLTQKEKPIKKRKRSTGKKTFECSVCHSDVKSTLFIVDINSCINCFADGINMRRKIIRAKESNYDGDLSAYNNISIELDEIMCKFNDKRTGALASECSKKLLECEKILANVQYSDEDLSSESEDNMSESISDDENIYSSDESSMSEFDDDDDEFYIDSESKFKADVFDYISSNGISNETCNQILDLYRNGNYEEIRNIMNSKKQRFEYQVELYEKDNIENTIIPSNQPTFLTINVAENWAIEYMNDPDITDRYAYNIIKKI